MKKLTLIIPALILFIVAILFLSFSTQTYLGRWLKWRASDILDYEKFPAHPFAASTHPFHFTPAHSMIFDTMTFASGKEIKLLQEVLGSSETTAFLIIKNDSLCFEGYFNGYKRESVNTSFSIAKSVTSLIIGKALEEGLIANISDPVTRYLPELRQTDPRYDEVTIAHLLNMRSGVQFKDHDLPWGDKPKAYYDPFLRQRVQSLPVISEPGIDFKYNSYNPIILGMVIERVSKQSPAKYFEEKIWNRLGMEYPGSWSLDSDKSRMTKMESGLNLRAVDLAKIGRLVLEEGYWVNDQVVSDEWIKSSTTVSPDNHIPEFGTTYHYENFWWLISSNQRKTDVISGTGHLGQFLVIFPENKLIIVRMGKGLGKVRWNDIFKQIAEHLK